MKQMSFTAFLAQCCGLSPHCLPWKAIKSPWSETIFWLLLTMLQTGNHKGDARNTEYSTFFLNRQTYSLGNKVFEITTA